MPTKEMPIWDHLEELRKRVFIAFGAVVAATLAAFFYSGQILEFLCRPLLAHISHFYFFSPQEAFLIRLKAAFIAGILFSAPVWVWQLWAFISPGLMVHEKKSFLPLVFIITALFIGGAVFAYYLVLPVGLSFLVSMQTPFLEPMISMAQYMDFVLMMLLAFGIAFNLPVVVMALAFIRILNTKVLNHYQRHAIVLIFILAAMLTPGPDIASQLLLAVPLLFLFEASVLGVWLLEAKRRSA
jgi:sec-independent protein translocase protein TatC